MPLLHTKSSKITFLASENFISNSADSTIKEFNTVTIMYKERGLDIEILHGDNGFNVNYLREHIRPVSLNTCAKGRNITIIVRSIQSIKKVARCTTHSFPCKR